MAKVKFPLDMGGGVMVRDIDELKENFSAEKVMEHFLSGKLLTWLKDRHYDVEAEDVEALSSVTDKNLLSGKLCEIFGVEIKNAVDVEAIEARNEKLRKLREITSDDEIIENVDSVAFSQEELGDLLDEDKAVIYLCGEKFRIPLSSKDKKYIGVNEPVISISTKKDVIDLEEYGIVIEKCGFSEETERKLVTKDSAPAEVNTSVVQETFELSEYMRLSYIKELKYPIFKNPAIPFPELSPDDKDWGKKLAEWAYASKVYSEYQNVKHDRNISLRTYFNDFSEKNHSGFNELKNLLSEQYSIARSYNKFIDDTADQPCVYYKSKEFVCSGSVFSIGSPQICYYKDNNDSHDANCAVLLEQYDEFISKYARPIIIVESQDRLYPETVIKRARSYFGTTGRYYDLGMLGALNIAGALLLNMPLLLHDYDTYMDSLSDEDWDNGLDLNYFCQLYIH